MPDTSHRAPMCNSTDPQPHSPLMLYSEAQRLEVTLCTPQVMASNHWHGQLEINLPFDGDLHYRIDDRQLTIPQGHMALFWACTPTAWSIPVGAARWRCSACRCISSSPGRWIAN